MVRISRWHCISLYKIFTKSQRHRLTVSSRCPSYHASTSHYSLLWGYMALSKVRDKKLRKESRNDGGDMTMMAEGDVVREENESTKVLFCTPYS